MRVAAAGFFLPSLTLREVSVLDKILGYCVTTSFPSHNHIRGTRPLYDQVSFCLLWTVILHHVIRNLEDMSGVHIG